MKQTKLIFLLLAAIMPCCWVTAQTNGFIYAHLQSINEENSADFPFVLKNSSGTTVASFSLNDFATATNSSTIGYMYTYDVGLSHGANGGDGQLWAIAGTSYQLRNNTAALNAGVYYRNLGSSQWVSNGQTNNIEAIDGAGVNQCVVVNDAGNVYMLTNTDVITTLYTGGDAVDVTANGGKIAIATSAGLIKVYSATYTTSGVTASQSWTTLYNTGISNFRIDMNLQATEIVYEGVNNFAVGEVTVPASGTGGVFTLLGNVGTLSDGYSDVAFDDDGTIYAIGGSSVVPAAVYHYNSGTSWTEEPQSSNVGNGLTAGAAHMAYAINIIGGTLLMKTRLLLTRLFFRGRLITRAIFTGLTMKG